MDKLRETQVTEVNLAFGLNLQHTLDEFASILVLSFSFSDTLDLTFMSDCVQVSASWIIKGITFNKINESTISSSGEREC